MSVGNTKDRNQLDNRCVRTPTSSNIPHPTPLYVCVRNQMLEPKFVIGRHQTTVNDGSNYVVLLMFKVVLILNFIETPSQKIPLDPRVV